jgi:hypothetical protein
MSITGPKYLLASNKIFSLFQLKNPQQNGSEIFRIHFASIHQFHLEACSNTHFADNASTTDNLELITKKPLLGKNGI